MPPQAIVLKKHASTEIEVFAQSALKAARVIGALERPYVLPNPGCTDSAQSCGEAPVQGVGGVMFKR
ncbi:protein of unknown function [Pseudomonas sp. JV551A1]|nr:protein of unknown function [Pseudomonas sp. JV551A1]